MKHHQPIAKRIIGNKFFIIIVLLSVIGLVGFISVKQLVNQPTKKDAQPDRFILTSDEINKKLSNAPNSGKPKYEFIDTYITPNRKTTQFIYYTVEFDDDRIIEMTDNILVDLKKSEKIDKDTNSFSISYFDDKDVARSYFKKIDNKKTPDSERFAMRKNYIATYVFSKDIDFSYIIKISSAKIIKKY